MEARKGFFVTVTGDATSPTTIYTVAINRKARIVKVNATNLGASAVNLYIAYVDVNNNVTRVLPAIPIAAGANVVYEESKIPAVEIPSTASNPKTIIAYLSAAGNVELAIEVAEA